MEVLIVNLDKLQLRGRAKFLKKEDKKIRSAKDHRAIAPQPDLHQRLSKRQLKAYKLLQVKVSKLHVKDHY